MLAYRLCGPEWLCWFKLLLGESDDGCRIYTKQEIVLHWEMWLFYYLICTISTCFPGEWEIVVWKSLREGCVRAPWYYFMSEALSKVDSFPGTDVKFFVPNIVAAKYLIKCLKFCPNDSRSLMWLQFWPFYNVRAYEFGFPCSSARHFKVGFTGKVALRV